MRVSGCTRVSTYIAVKCEESTPGADSGDETVFADLAIPTAEQLLDLGGREWEDRDWRTQLVHKVKIMTIQSPLYA